VTHLDDAVTAILATIDARTTTHHHEQARRTAVHAMHQDGLSPRRIRAALIAELQARGLTGDQLRGLGVSVGAIRVAIENPPPPD